MESFFNCLLNEIPRQNHIWEYYISTCYTSLKKLSILTIYFSHLEKAYIFKE